MSPLRAESRPSSTGPPAARVFGSGDDIEGDNRSSGVSPLRRIISHRPSILSGWRSVANDEAVPSPAHEERPLIPSALQQPGEPYTTPLPKLPMAVLSITLLGEFLTANVSTPFLLFMVEGFGEFSSESDVGFYTGLLVATFFFTQFLTSLLWATIADRHGQRLVLLISLIGGSLTCALFGTATSLKQAVAIRLMQGVFAGAIGVARGCVTTITDPSNEGRAYAILGFCWGFGGVAGAIVGGTFESPAKKWPDVFGKLPLFVNYPYLLPTCIAATVTLAGALLSLFLGPDGGPREGAIRLPPEKITGTEHPTIPEEDSTPPSPTTSPPRKASIYDGLRGVSRRFSGMFASRVPDQATSSPVPLSQSASGNRPFIRMSRANGSAYGYGGGRVPSFRSRLNSNMSGASYRRGSLSSMALRRRASGATATHGDGGPRSFGTESDLNFAQRLLMANENAVTNIADLWVAAAMNVDNEEVFESEDTELEGPFDGIYDWDVDEQDEDPIVTLDDTPTRRGTRTSHVFVPSGPSTRHSSHVSAFRRPSTSQQQGLRSPQSRRPSQQQRAGTPGSPFELVSPPRRFSNAVPAIFAHPGVRTPPAVAEAQRLLSAPEPIQALDNVNAALAEEAKPPSLMSQLPLAIIVQYGLLALHSTTHDMLFLSYLVSKYESGGLNLNAGHFSQLIALMCLAQIAYQFYLYPNIGPPRGRFSHLAMFRLGSLLFIPAYISVTMYRAFASSQGDGSVVLMGGKCLPHVCSIQGIDSVVPKPWLLARECILLRGVLGMSTEPLSRAVRYCGTTFAYTSVSILLNYMSPPPVVGMANGIAQSIVSLARCFGPILGGYLWSATVEGNPSGYYIGFFVVAGTCGLAVTHSMFIR
ncbi:hypothetical protein BC834DRAFT_874860 [Gloeopeniophorella convolvens]|nr:hypothetical protein BC834DRAFT_874860 [Gloeopeniophorella convolvens]